MEKETWKEFYERFKDFTEKEMEIAKLYIEDRGLSELISGLKSINDNERRKVSELESINDKLERIGYTIGGGMEDLKYHIEPISTILDSIEKNMHKNE